MTTARRRWISVLTGACLGNRLLDTDRRVHWLTVVALDSSPEPIR
jgi:hypothetical protein